METHYYNVEIKWSKDRKGMMCSPETVNGFVDDRSCIEIATPPEFPKGIAGIWSPEHLFTAAVGSCLMTTFLAIAENSHLEFTDFSCKSKGRLEKVEGKFMMTEVELTAYVTILREKDTEKAERVLRKSEEVCLISNSIKSKVTMSPIIMLSEPQASTSLVQ
jgi:organic hydroperoxide reductase OsmC/OhrA